MLVGSPGTGQPDHIGRRLALRSRIPLDSLTAASLRWARENQGKHYCQCGCGAVIRLQPRHYWRGAPRHVHGHQNRRGHWRVFQLKQAGYLTTSGCRPSARDRDHDPAPQGGNHLSPRRPDWGDPGLSRRGRRNAPTPGQETVKSSRRGIALARSAPATASYSEDDLPSRQAGLATSLPRTRTLDPLIKIRVTSGSAASDTIVHNR